jgi:hypothetical protein
MISATIITLVNLGIVIGPATWLGLGAVDGLQSFASQLAAGTLVVPSPPAGVKVKPRWQPFKDPARIWLNFPPASVWRFQGI